MKISKKKYLVVFSILLFLVSFISIPVMADDNDTDNANDTETKVDADEEKAKESEEKEKKEAEEKKKKEEEKRRKAKNTCDNFIKDDAPLLGAAYGITIDYDMDSTHKFIIRMNKSLATNSKQEVYSSAKFKLTQIDVINLNEDFKEVSSQNYKVGTNEFEVLFGNIGNQVLTEKNNITFGAIDGGVHRYRATIESYGFTDPDYTKNCGSVPNSKMTMTVVLDYDYFGEAYHTTDSINEVALPSPGSTGIIDCDHNTYSPTKNAFEHAFCKDRKAAIDSGVKQLVFTTELSTYEKLARSKSWDTAVSYHCDPFGPIVNKTETNSKEYKYTNTDYLWGIIDYHIPSGQYTYNFGGQNTNKNSIKFGQSIDPSMVEKESVSCTVRCEEIVTVEYGPPVASKAGLCFNYQIKVTSRVNCSIKEPPVKPRVIKNYCTPSPGCNHGNGYVDHAAGPNEDFDACVSACDGGKYSKKCSLECYNEVYKGITIRNNMSYNLYDEIGATRLGLQGNNTQNRTDLSNVCEMTDNKYLYGYYYHDPKKNAILWSPSSKLARWYCENNYRSGHACVKTEGEGGGISAVCGCSAVCRWNGCKDNATGKVPYYLNPNEAGRDYTKNIAEYQRVLNECEAYSRCSTTQAEFTLDVDYAYGNPETKTTIHFPYTGNNDKTSSDMIQYNSEHKTVTCTTNNKNSTLISSNGCYTCAEKDSKNDSTGSSNNWYQTEWGFPGTWMNSKTGIMEFKQPSTTGWIRKDKEFCIPFDTNNVNQKWWNAYYLAHYKDDTRFSYSSTSTTSCQLSSCDTAESSFTKADEANLKYNIRGSAKKFGLLEWNVNISCFYALNTNFPKHETGESCTFSNPDCPDGTKKVASQKIKIRSVDLANLFPAEDGAMLSSSDVSGRIPGFNWSAYATNVIKDPNYSSRPSFYMQWVQSHGNSIYSEDYLDYEINLSKEDIRNIKNQDHNFSNFEGTTVMNSVINYKSNLFRGGNAILSNVKVPSEQALLCNNIKNYSSLECEDFLR